MATAREPEEHEGLVADDVEQRGGEGGPAEAAEEAEAPGVVDLTETTLPARRFYANLADL